MKSTSEFDAVRARELPLNSWPERLLSCFSRAFDTSLGLVCSQVAADESLRFTFERTPDETPYWQQGDSNFDTPEAQAMRAALRKDARVLNVLELFWNVYAKDSYGMVTREEYLRVHVKLALVLIPDITPEEAYKAGEDDWAADAKGASTMSKDGLFDCLFELSDMWCSGIDGDEYATFLRKLFRRVTVRYSIDASGQMSKLPPKPPPHARLLEYVSFRDSRRISLGLLPGPPPAAAAPEPPPQPELEAAVEEAAPAEAVEVTEEAAPAEPAEVATGDEVEAVAEAPVAEAPVAEVAVAEVKVAEAAVADSDDDEEEAVEHIVHYGWANDADVFPLILYEKGPIDWTEYDATTGAEAPAPPALVAAAL